MCQLLMNAANHSLSQCNPLNKNGCNYLSAERTVCEGEQRASS